MASLDGGAVARQVRVGTWRQSRWAAAVLPAAILMVLIGRAVGYQAGVGDDPVASEAYIAGFSNRAAIVTLWGMLLLIALVLRQTTPRQAIPMDRAMGIFRHSPAKPGSTAALVTMIAMFALVALTLWWFIPDLSRYGEAQYQIRRVDLALAFGMTPYRQIEFGYGPLFIYGPMVVAGLGSYLGVPLDLSYVLFTILNCALGLWCLFWVLHWLEMPAVLRQVLFVIVAMSFAFNLALGLQAGPLRYFLPLAMLLQQWRLYRLATTEEGRRWWFAAFTAAAAALAWSISPDVGVVWCGGQVVAAADRQWSRQTGALTLLTANIVGTAAVMALVSTRYFEMLLAVGGGVGNFPWEPSPFIVLYVAALLIVVATYGVSVSRQNAGPARSFGLAVMAMLFAAVPAALGRCDVFHVTLNGAPALLLALAIITRARRAWFPAAVLLYTVVFVLAHIMVLLWSYTENLQPLTSRLLGESTPANADALAVVAALHLDGFDRIATPERVNPQIEQWLRQTGRFAPLYYPDTFNIDVPSRLRDFQQRLRSEQVLLVPVPFTRVAPDRNPPAMTASEVAAINRNLSMTMLYPVRIGHARTPLRSLFELARFMGRHYDTTASAGGYAVMVRRADATSVSPARLPAESAP